MKENATDRNGISRGKVYVLSFEDIQGKIQKIKFSSEYIEKSSEPGIKGKNKKR